MKNLLSTIALLAISTVAFAQTNLLTNGDFEGGTTGWEVNYGDPATPDIRTDDGNSYFFADVETVGDAFAVNLKQIIEITQGTTYRFSFDASSAGDGRTIIAGIGLNEDPWNAVTETVTLTATSQTFSYDMTAADFGIPNSRVLFDMGADTGIVVIDNVSLVVTDSGSGGGGGASTPTVAAPTPPGIDAAGVVSIFSDAFTDVGVGTFATDWSEGTTATMDTVAGDPIIRFDFVNFSGIQLDASVDLSTMTHAHMDYWVADDLTAGEVLNFKLSNHGGLPDTEGETDASELTNPVTTSGEWVSLDVPLTDFAVVFGSSAIDKVYQIVLSVSGTLDRVYVDNLYFYNSNSVSNEISELPNGFTLEQNYPNPFNPSTNISYSVPVTSEVTLEVFNLQGQKVATLFDGVQSAGAHTAAFDASSLASGVYVYRLVSGNNIQVKKMMLIK